LSGQDEPANAPPKRVSDRNECGCLCHMTQNARRIPGRLGPVRDASLGEETGMEPHAITELFASLW